MVFDTIPTEIVILLFPIIVLVLWQLLFNSQNAMFTKAIVEGVFMLLGIPVDDFNIYFNTYNGNFILGKYTRVW